jgi:putative ABC transport system permease protein
MTMQISIIKIFRDLKYYKGRTLLTAIGILIGLVAVGTVLSAYSVLKREINHNFMDTNPSSIVYYVNNLDNRAIDLIKQKFGKIDIDVRKTITGRIGNGDGTYGIIQLIAIPEFDNQKVDRFSLEKGNYPAGNTDMVLERDCFKILKNIKKTAGQELLIKIPGGKEIKMQLSGIVHAPGLPPASMENYSYAFMKIDALDNMGYTGWYDEIHIVSYDQRFDHSQMKSQSLAIKEYLQKNGYKVNRVDVPVPGRHPHASQLSAILFLLQVFTVISLLAACMIIINLMGFIISRQSRQIAVMKATGATSYKIMLPFFGYTFIISVAGLILSIPLSVLAASGYADFAAYVLNFNITRYAVPHWVFAVQIWTGILIPAISAAFPIYKGCTKSVISGLTEKMDGTDGMATKNIFIKKIFFITGSKIIMPINNLLRRRRRAILAILALSAGGILFMTSQNIVASISKTVDVSMKAFRWDFYIRLYKVYPEDRLKKVLDSINGLDRKEIWGTNTIHFKKPDGTDSANYSVKIVPQNSKMIQLSNKNFDYNAIAVNQVIADDERWIKPGNKAKVEINGQIVDIVVADIVNEIPPMPAVYMNVNTYNRFFSSQTMQIILANSTNKDVNSQLKIKKEIEEVFKSNGIEISENWSIFVFRKAFVDHLYVIITFLSIIAMLAIVVGGLSIASAIGISISERKREIGVLRAVGVRRYQVITMISIEVILMGIAGWIAGLVLSFPISVHVGNYFGQIFLHSNLENTLSFTGAYKWFGISVIIAFLSALIPAWKAATAPLREMLSYE